MRASDAQKITVALAGNPNVGKSTLFNALTGLRQHTGNWPGKTVGVATGTLHKGDKVYEFVDLPGTYSLSGQSEDERIAGDYISSGSADCTVIVCDGSSLERSLILTLQILERTHTAVICVNLMDEAKRNGIIVDANKLSRHLGAPVILTSAGKKQGIRELVKQIDYTARDNGNKLQKFGDPIASAERIAGECITVAAEQSGDFRRNVERLLVSKRFGIPIMLAVLLLVVWLTVWGANYPSELLGRFLDGGYWILKSIFSGVPEWISGLLIDGVYATAARVISVMLPPMAIFFPLFTILEDIGYLPRMAFLLDGGMQKCGGCGKQALTMCMGLGCNAVGVTGCRIIDSPRERLQAILTNAMIPCNGRFPTLIILASLFTSGFASAFGVAGCIALGIMGAMGASGLLSKTFLRHEKSVFLMEMPPFRRPRIGQILVRSLIDRTLHIGARALKVAAPAGALLWLMGNTSALAACASFMDPIGSALGMNGAVILAFFLSLPANELFLPVVIMLATGTGNLHSVVGTGEELLLSMNWTLKMAVCTMVFTLFHWPCATTLITVYKETGSIKETAAAFVLPTAVGIVLCFVLNLLL